MKKTFSGILVAALALAGVVGTSTKADAAFMAYICDDIACSGGGDTVVTDGLAGDATPGVAGLITAQAVNVAGFTVALNLASSKPLIGSAAAPQLDLTFNAATNDNLTHTVFLYAQDTGFTGTGTGTLTGGGTQVPVTGNSIIARGWGGATNTNTADPRAVGPLFVTSTLSTSNPFVGTATGIVPVTTNPYALTIGIAITRGSAGQTTGDLNLSVPEPASMALFGLGLMGFGVANRRRKANQAK